MSAAIDELVLDCLVRSNRTGRAADEAIRLYQFLPVLEGDGDAWNAYYGFLKSQNVIQAALRVRRELRELGDEGFAPLLPAHADVVRRLAAACIAADAPLIVYPMLWPLAFGDVLALHQFIRRRKAETPGSQVALLMPLNRPDLRQLAELNDALDAVVDVTLRPEEERDRLRTLGLEHQGLLVLSHQERVIVTVLHVLEAAGVRLLIEKPRYFPVLDGWRYQAGWRVWERRAELWLREGCELPKLVEQTSAKRRAITVHFRAGAYAESGGRNVETALAQGLVDALAARYPGYELVRLGDASMPRLERCRNASHEDWTVGRQIQAIQESMLFLGCHSGPQHLAVACSDTPVIVTNYTVAPTCTEMGPNIAKTSNEPVGSQVRAVLYNRMWDAAGHELLPSPTAPAVRVEMPSIDAVVREASLVLDGNKKERQTRQT